MNNNDSGFNIPSMHCSDLGRFFVCCSIYYSNLFGVKDTLVWTWNGPDQWGLVEGFPLASLNLLNNTSKFPTETTTLALSWLVRT